MKISNCCKVEAPYNRKDGYFHCGKCNKPCTPIEEPTEEKCPQEYKYGGCTDIIDRAKTVSPKDTCEEEDELDRLVKEWELFSKTDNTFFHGTLNEQRVITSIWWQQKVASLLSQKEATAREEGREEIKAELLKMFDEAPEEMEFEELAQLCKRFIALLALKTN